MSVSVGAHQEPRMHVVGVDLGATTIGVGIFNQEGTPQAIASQPIEERDFESVCNQISAVIKSALNGDTSGVKCIGIGAPGNLDFDQGLVINAANFEGWSNVPLAARLSAAFGGAPVTLSNDAVAALQGEAWNGAAKSKRNVVMITLGSGVGGGAMVDGHLLHGAKGMAAEIGHMIAIPNGRLNANTGVNGIVEEFVSCNGIARRAKLLLGQGEASSLHGLAGSVSQVESKHVYQAAADGDPLSVQLLEQVHELIGILCINMCRAYDPEVIVLSGGLTQAGSALFDPVRAAFNKHHWTLQDPTCVILASESDPASGAAFSALQKMPEPCQDTTTTLLRGFALGIGCALVIGLGLSRVR